MKNLILVIVNRGFHAFYLSVYFKITQNTGLFKLFLTECEHRFNEVNSLLIGRYLETSTCMYKIKLILKLNYRHTTCVYIKMN